MHGDNLRIAYRHFPLTTIHDKAEIAAEAAEAAGAQGKFWEMHDLLFQRQQEWGGLPVDQMPEVLAGYAQELGLEVERFSEELENRTYQAKVESSYAEATSLGLGGTPSFVINSRLYPWNLSYQGLETFIQLTLVDLRQYDGPPPQKIDPEKKYTATIRTSKGDIVAELFADQAPTNVNSFVFLAQDKWYDGQAFFYVRPDLAAQSGDPTNTGSGLPYPGYYCGDELDSNLTFDQAGMVAMFAPAPDSNGSQFFITYDAIPQLDGNYTIIGRIVEGIDVAESLTPRDPSQGVGLPPGDVIEMILIEER